MWAVGSQSDAQILKQWCKSNSVKTSIYSGEEGLEKLATLPDVSMVFASVVGSVGLKSVIAAIKAKTILTSGSVASFSNPSSPL
ncbi:MAG: hypothetical protein LE168_05495 [Endomicrobium sp.]|nr:hypothetical protein [Endomicrobium sp.]